MSNFTRQRKATSLETRGSEARTPACSLVERMRATAGLDNQKQVCRPAKPMVPELADEEHAKRAHALEAGDVARARAMGWTIVYRTSGNVAWWDVMGRKTPAHVQSDPRFRGTYNVITFPHVLRRMLAGTRDTPVTGEEGVAMASHFIVWAALKWEPPTRMALRDGHSAAPRRVHESTGLDGLRQLMNLYGIATSVFLLGGGGVFAEAGALVEAGLGLAQMGVTFPATDLEPWQTEHLKRTVLRDFDKFSEFMNAHHPDVGHAARVAIHNALVGGLK